MPTVRSQRKTIQFSRRNAGLAAALICLSILIAALGAPLRGQDSGAKVAASPAKFSPRDLTGVWMPRQNEISFSAAEPPMQAWAEAKYRAVRPSNGPRATLNSQDPTLNCIPPGFPRILLAPFPMQIVSAPGEIFMLFEYNHFIRQIFLERRTHPNDLDASWMGDSIGHWEGETLVVDTVGLNEKSWLDPVGHPHSDALHVVERIRRVDRDTLQDDLMFDDPKTYTKPWTGRQIFTRKPTWRLMEYVCEDTMLPPMP